MKTPNDKTCNLEWVDGYLSCTINHHIGTPCLMDERNNDLILPRTFVLGDLHGGYKALMQCLERARFDYNYDRLISLGDIADGWTEVVECFEEFFKMKYFIMVRGNHDQWLKEYLTSGDKPDIWTKQGGQNTLMSYYKHGEEMEKKHLAFLKTTKHWYVDDKNRLFVHGGFKNGVPLELQDKMELMWSRDFANMPEKCFNITDFEHVFVGHTSVWRHSQVPLTVGKVTFMDTGGGW